MIVSLSGTSLDEIYTGKHSTPFLLFHCLRGKSSEDVVNHCEENMFTGIISDIGEITELKNNGDVRARIKCNYTSAEIDLGASIACDGICLTVVDRGLGKENWFDVDISAETVSKTTISASANGWGIGRKINLERSLKVGDELGGHIVSGHVDGVATIKSIEIEGDSTRMTFEISSDLSRFIASKGSVSLNGTSLTVNEVNKNTFGVNLIAHTKSVTTWENVALDDLINLEIDTLARYVARLTEVKN